MLRYACSLPNAGLTGPTRHYFYQDSAAGQAHADAWAKRENGPGRAIYDCVGLLADGARWRCRETVAALDKITVDLDLRNIAQSREEVAACLKRLPLPPSLLKDSGWGLHPEWHFKELAADEAGMALAESITKHLAALLAGDQMPTHRAALMRRPGTDNTKKEDDWRRCHVLETSGATYDITELEEMVDQYGDRPLLTAKEKPKTNGHDPEGMAAGGPVDVEARYAAMKYEGEGLTGIHITKLHCTGSRTRDGVPVADIAAEAVEAVRRAVAGDPRAEGWDWEEEKRDAEGMCYSIINKSPELACLLSDELFAAWQGQLNADKAPKIVHDRRGGWHVIGVPGRSAEPDKETSGGSAAATAAWPTPYSGRDVTRIPRRQFLLGLHYLLGVVTVTAAAGGVGKSILTLLDMVSFAIGRNLLTGEELERRYRAWVWNAEDDIDEMERRVAGICVHYGIDRAELDGWLFLDSGFDLPLDLAQGNGRTTIVREELIGRIATRVKELGIEVVGLDPLVALHTMPESDNPSLAKLIRTLNNKLAKPCGCGVDINHHTRKMAAGQDGQTADDVRGGGTIVYSARSTRMLIQMGLGEAEKYGIEADDRFLYFRLERVKANMARRGTVCWVRLVETPVANGPGGSAGDVVTVPTLWVPPDAMEGISDAVAAAICAAVAKGRYQRSARSGSAWAGKLVGRQLKFDTETAAGRQRARTVLEKLILRGVLAVDIEYDKNRNAKEIVVPGSGAGSNPRGGAS